MRPGPERGDIWLVDLNPTRGHEQAGRRPALIFSVDEFNSGPAELGFVIPITSTIRRVPTHVVRVGPRYQGDPGAKGLFKNNCGFC